MKNTPLSNIEIILCNTSHPGNIGSAARAMKTMGLYNLTLVEPITQPDDHSLALACNAKDVVENCTISDNLKHAIQDSQLVIAMTGRKREFNDRLMTPKEIVPEILTAIHNNEKVSIVFGNEQNGLTIEQQECCNRLVTIPGNPEYCSLNLSQAVQIMCYEIYSTYNPNVDYYRNPVDRVTELDIQHLLNNLDQTLQKIDFYQHKNPERTLRRLQNVFHKAELEREEADLLHGIIRQIRRKIQE